MKKNDVIGSVLRKYRLKKMLMIMKLCVLLTFLFNLNASVLSQHRISMQFGEVGYKQVFSEITKQIGLTFMCSDSGLKKDMKVIAHFNNADLERVLKTVLKGKKLTYL